MTRLKSYGKRAVCVLMLALVLSQTVASNYMQGYEVKATGMEAWLFQQTFFELFVGHLGYGFSSYSDRDKAAQAFSRWLTNVKERSSDFAQAYREFTSPENKARGASFAMTSYVKLAYALKYWVTNVLKPAKGKATTKATTSGKTIITYDNDNCFSVSKTLRSMYGSESFSDSSSLIINFDSVDFVAHKYMTEADFKKLYPDFYNANKAYQGKYDYFVLYAHHPNWSSGYWERYPSHALYPTRPYFNSYGSKYWNDSGQETICKIGNLYKSINLSTQKAAEDGLRVYVFARGTALDKFNRLGLTPYSGLKVDGIPANIFDSSDIWSAAPYFDSIDDLNAIGDLSRTLDINGLYGNGTSTYDLPATVTIGDDSLQKAIADAISDAMAKNVSKELTAEEINAIVDNAVIDYTKTLEDINENIDRGTQETVIGNSWLSKIYYTVLDIQGSLAARTDGSSDSSDTWLSSLSSQVDAITKALAAGNAQRDDAAQRMAALQAAIIASLAASSAQPDPDDNDDDEKEETPVESPSNEPKIWGLGAFTAAGLLQPLIKIFSEPLSQLTKWQNKISKQIQKQTELQTEQANKNVEEHSSSINKVLDFLKGLAQDVATKTFNSFKDSLDNIQNEIKTQGTKQVEQAVKVQEANMEGIKNVVEILTNFPQEIALKSAEAFSLTLGGIQTSLDTVATVAADLGLALANMPVNLPQLISQGIKSALETVKIPLEFPDTMPVPEQQPLDIKLPDLSILQQILQLLQQILEAIKEFFKLDTAQIQEAWDKQVELGLEASGVKQFKGLVAAFNFTDSYEYPVIKAQTPSIIQQFTHQDYIVLFDGKDYKDYFVVFRNILIAVFWLTYAYACICKIKVRFSLS